MPLAGLRIWNGLISERRETGDMFDKYGREIDYIRISVTDRCNLRCLYCMPEEGVSMVSHEEILSYDEIVT